ncbi:6986_t:CDS:2, partial [Cetraspora pellucida]
MSDTTMTQFELSENLDSFAPYYCKLRASNIDAYLYKIRDDSVRPRNFLGTDSEYSIEAILSDHEGHSLHEFIGGDKPLHPIIDFDLPIETLNAITPKDKKNITVATSSNAKKISLHISTTGMWLKNIAQIAVFTELVHKKLQIGLQKKSIIDNIANKRSFFFWMLGSPKYKEETKEHVHIKKAIYPKDGTIFDFMIHLPNNESEVIKSPLLDVSENISRRKCSTMSNITTEAEFKLARHCLKRPILKAIISHFCQKISLINFYYHAFLHHIAYYVIRNTQPGMKNPSLKLTISETALDREKKLPSKKFSCMIVYEAIQAMIACVQKKMKTWILKHRNLNSELMFDIGPKLDIANFTINIIELGENIWCNGNKNLSVYVLKWLAFLIQYLSIIPGTILVLRSPPRCEKNIITDFIQKSLFGPDLVFSTSDLGKILEWFNSPIQAQKLIIINETGMASSEWHKANDHLKALITENYVSIECKGLEFQDCNHFAGFIILSNHNAPIRIKIEDGRIICLDVSPYCKNNFAYFDQLGGILEHPDTPESFMSYLLSLNLSGWKPCKIPSTKMKIETMRDQLPNHIRFIIDYIASWPEDKIAKLSSNILYQEYFDWCGGNREKLFSNNILGKKFLEINIERKRASGRKREWQYILDHSKIITKLYESGLDDIEEFFDTPQPDLPENETTNIPIFNVPEFIPPKIILPQAEKNLSPSDKKADKQKNLIQALPEPKILISGVVPDTPSKETDSSKPINEISFAILLSRAQCKERLRKRAIELSEDPNKFVTITEKDRLDSTAFQSEEDPKENMEMTVRERLIGEEIIWHELKEKEITSSWLDTDEEWQKNISILQEN